MTTMGDFMEPHFCGKGKMAIGPIGKYAINILMGGLAPWKKTYQKGWGTFFVARRSIKKFHNVL